MRDDSDPPHMAHNTVVHLLDSSCFGLALGFASFITILPLWLGTLTSSATLVGLATMLHPAGWHLPQVVAAHHARRLERFLPTMLRLTLAERLPFFGLAAVALASPRLGKGGALALTYVLVLTIGIGGGFAAASFQSLVAKIMPARRRGAFYGAKTGAASLGIALGAVLAGRILAARPGPGGFSTCFLLAGLATGASYVFLALTREERGPPAVVELGGEGYRWSLGEILRRDTNFRWFLCARMLSQLAVMGAAYYVLFAKTVHGLGPILAGLLTAVFALAQAAGNVAMGIVGDRVGHRLVMAAGMLCASAGAVVAMRAPTASWFAAVFLLAGLANVAAWTMPLAMILEFGEPARRPAYIGLGNSLVAPSILIAPLVGGWAADSLGFQATFGLAAAAGIVTALVLVLKVSAGRAA